jgi:hypothetical protein
MTTATNKNEFKKLVTPVFRASYPAIFSAALPMGETDEKKAKYGITMLFDITKPEVAKGVAEMKALAMEAATKAWGPDMTKWPAMKYKLFRKGDEPEKKDKAGFGPNVVFCKASLSLFKKTGERRLPPGIVDAYGKAIIDPSDFKGGDYARACINAYTYDYMGNKGISFGLISVRKERDGEAFASVHNAANDFDGIPMPEGLPAAAATPPGAAQGGGFEF